MISRSSALVFLILSALMFAQASAPAFEEASLLDEVNPEELRSHTREITRYVRPSGSAGEFAAIDYIVKMLRSDGIPVEVFEFPAYVSDPVSCSLRVDGAGGREITCLTQALAAPTEGDGVSGEIVDCGKGSSEDYAKTRVQGKIALVDGLPYPWGVQAAEKAGAIGAIFVAASERIHELTVSPIWGTPSHKDHTELPSIPSAAIRKSDGQGLRKASESGAVRVRLQTEVDTGWRPLRLALASIRSGKDPEGFVLLGGHIDAWHYGANDEGASNAAMLEIARIFYRHRDELERGLKVAWWPGHSNGRYAGSTWFVDSFWTDLRENALAYMNVDGLGQMEASVYRAASTAEMDRLAQAVFTDVAQVDVEPHRPGRNSDQSFYGVGLPLLQFDHRRTDGNWGYWWWHTPEDTFDKVDFDILAGDTRLYVAALHRLLSRPVPPIHVSAATAELKRLLEGREKTAGSHLDLTAALERARRLHTLALTLDEKIEHGSTGSLAPSEFSRRMVRVLRPILRMTYQEKGPYHQDPALPVPTLPGLAALDSLAKLDPQGNLYGFTRAYLLRERNRVLDHLEQAIEEAETLARKLTSSTSNRTR